MLVEEKTVPADFVARDELYTMQNYQGIPEFDIALRENYEVPAGGKVPVLRFFSNKPDDEPLPLPDHHTSRYSDLHYELEKWTLFNQLPKLLSYDKHLNEQLLSIQ